LLGLVTIPAAGVPVRAEERVPRLGLVLEGQRVKAHDVGLPSRMLFVALRARALDPSMESAIGGKAVGQRLVAGKAASLLDAPFSDLVAVGALPHPL